MSQGEIHALALSLFLPRATMAESPFRFVVIDDPVQAMDPARVEGLAAVLEEVAKERQVIVFTHDDRLPEAIRRLQIAAHVIEVTRKTNSVVELRPGMTPSSRALDDAMSLAQAVKHGEVPLAVGRRVVPGFCRIAIDAACAEVVRRRRLGRGEAHAHVEDLLSRATKTAARLVLAVFDDENSRPNLYADLEGRFGRTKVHVFKQLNKGAHGEVDSDIASLVGLVRNTEHFVEAVLCLP